MSAAALYTPAVLGLATSLADFSCDGDWQHRGAARSPTCGSAIELGLELDSNAAISRLGVKASACAIGQAAAALFAQHATGQTRAEINTGLQQIEAWLAGGALPDWPGIGQIAAARAFPARHGAVLLAWRAALVALPG